MTDRQFNMLCSCKELRQLLIAGACIGTRNAENMQVLLFQKQKQYVEVFLNPSTDEVVGSRTFKSTKGLQPYLQPAQASS